MDRSEATRLGRAGGAGFISSSQFILIVANLALLFRPGRLCKYNGELVGDRQGGVLTSDQLDTGLVPLADQLHDPGQTGPCGDVSSRASLSTAGTARLHRHLLAY